MQKIFLALAILMSYLFFTSTLNAQSNNSQIATSINAAGNPPDPSALLDIQATNKGILIPRMSSIARVAIPSPTNGLLVFDSSLQEFYFYNQQLSAWVPINLDGDTSASNELQTLTVNGNSLVISGGNSVVMPGFVLLEDADADTKIQVEEAGDEDIIRFDLGGTEHYVMNGPRIEVLNTGASIYIGEGAGLFTVQAPNNHNTAVGFDSFKDNTTGVWNTGFGADALHHNSTGDFNTAVGKDAFHESDFGDRNTAIGAEAGYICKGSNCTFLGSISRGTTTLLDNVTAVGYNTVVSASNMVRIGSSNVNSIGGYASWTNVSDLRFKDAIKEDIQGLSFIQQLRPVSYELNRTKISRFNGQEDTSISTDQSGSRQVGFIAQEVEETAKKLGFDFSGIEAPANEQSHYGLRYAEFVVPLVKGMQEQQAIIEAQANEIATLKSQFAELENTLIEIKAQINN